jgi:hypothetical protein
MGTMKLIAYLCCFILGISIGLEYLNISTNAIGAIVITIVIGIIGILVIEAIDNDLEFPFYG